MRVHIATDHAGFELKGFLVTRLAEAGWSVVDHGAAAYEPDDDYPTTVIPCARACVETGERGVVLGGSGNGEQIAANKVPGCRAALAYSPETARLAREHNDAHVIGIGARMHTPDEAWEIVQTFLAADFSGAERHVRRLAQVAAFEQKGTLAP
ncbi:ribose-5-phosphate isomerase [Granulicoccus sp. GXG6511]|uniref:ribose-5-phosphate isomerase n=1 Tax=Granulicoccus sp. GXG6511 TaxID=3381351 RepID=UPI003D7DEFB8